MIVRPIALSRLKRFGASVSARKILLLCTLELVEQ